MPVDRSLLTGSTTLLVLKLLENKDMYGYEMIEQLGKRSQNVFALKAGTLYPLLHGLEKKGMVQSYDREAGGRTRKYYKLTNGGRKLLAEKRKEWDIFSSAVASVLKGGAHCEQT
ncbi:PadR family transcriptional regulator [Christensenella tenuis]|uniref:Helix-turn-helix transcriptional regulator n=1 Tax=Christensenella tenuis TaxID=2763033 RepID=A0ABR7EF85_9FIRM|nr:helix-turn-helix transcriptional regulator [Christensenella tenuis]MBC5648323.1 helix-turn-helix transcriptional regulator [Christensenella tenuis]